MPKTISNAVTDVSPDSPASHAGISIGDKILSINSNTIRDELDLMFYSQEPIITLTIKRDNKNIKVSVEKEEFEALGVTLEPLKVRTCKNNCIFCFVHQLPKGLRRSLYVKDEDYRFSFLYGNYVTLSNMTERDRKRIIEQRLTPLYISVHTTNHELRKTMLGNPRASNIMAELKCYKSHKIKFHTQIVLCPGYNDNEELEQTIRDLARLYPYMSSIAVVPVGLTKHRRTALKPVTPEDAKKALSIVEKFQKRFLKKYGDPLVYGADELFIKAGEPFPPIRFYGDFPQIENGVGMVPQFLHEAQQVRFNAATYARKHFITFTGSSFYPFLKPLVQAVQETTHVDLKIIPVTNTFFGDSVTVTGLLTGGDIITAISDHLKGADILLIPDVVLKDSDTVLLDDMSIEDIQGALNIEIRVVDSTPNGLLKGLEEHYEY